MAVAVVDKRGLKRICMSCGNRFYDMNKRPVTCPSCQAVFSGEMKVKSRRPRAAVSDDDGQVTKAAGVKAAPAEDEEDEILPGDDDTVSLDEVEDEEEVAEDDEELDADLELDDDIEDLEDLEEDDLDEDDDDEEDDEDEDEEDDE